MFLRFVSSILSSHCMCSHTDQLNNINAIYKSKLMQKVMHKAARVVQQTCRVGMYQGMCGQTLLAPILQSALTFLWLEAMIHRAIKNRRESSDSDASPLQVTRRTPAANELQTQVSAKMLLKLKEKSPGSRLRTMSQTIVPVNPDGGSPSSLPRSLSPGSSRGPSRLSSRRPSVEGTMSLSRVE